MKKVFSIIGFVVSMHFSLGQYKMRPVNELIIEKNPGWIMLKQWIGSAKNQVEVLSADPLKMKEALYHTQVTTRSIMGAMVYCTGGILVDNGWIRFLGSGHPKMKRTLPDWNKGKAFNKFGEPPAFFLVADDAAGGYFAVNYGPFGKDMDNIYYLSPNSLEWETLNMNYEDFIKFCFNGDLKKFYNGIRWSTWKKDMNRLKADAVFHILPPLWSKQGKDIEKSYREPVPAEEQFLYNMDLRKKMGIE